MEGRGSENTQSNTLIILFLVLSVAFFIITGLFGRSQLSPLFTWLQDWGQVLAGLGSLVLTGYLAYLYTQIVDSQDEQVATMEKQAEAMEDQINWMAAQQSPHIRISNLQSYSGHLPPIAGSNDYLAVELNNEGLGPAKNLYQRCDIWVFQNDSLVPIEEVELTIDNWEFQIKPTKWNFSRIDRFSSSIDDISFQFRQRTQGGLLPAGEEHWYFSQVNMMVYPDDNGQSASFQDAMLLLAEAGVDKVAFQISLLYRDPAGNIQGDPLISGQHEIGDEYTLEGFSPYSGFSGSMSMILEKVRESEDLPPY